MSRVGEKVKSARTEAGLSQKQLAKKLGVAESFIKEVEQGTKVINESLMSRISKALGKDLNDVSMSFEEEIYKEEPAKKELRPKNVEKVNDVWSDALGSVLKSVPVYKYDLNKVLATRQLPLISNKIEGYGQDKVFFLEIEEDDMIGYRIAKGDIAFAHLTGEIENNAICLIDYNGTRAIRQIKKLDATKLLLVSNRGSVRTETVGNKDIKGIAKLERVEIKL